MTATSTGSSTPDLVAGDSGIGKRGAWPPRRSSSSGREGLTASASSPAWRAGCLLEPSAASTEALAPGSRPGYSEARESDLLRRQGRCPATGQGPRPRLCLRGLRTRGPGDEPLTRPASAAGAAGVRAATRSPGQAFWRSLHCRLSLEEPSSGAGSVSVLPRGGWSGAMVSPRLMADHPQRERGRFRSWSRRAITLLSLVRPRWATPGLSVRRKR